MGRTVTQGWDHFQWLGVAWPSDVLPWLPDRWSEACQGTWPGLCVAVTETSPPRGGGLQKLQQEQGISRTEAAGWVVNSDKPRYICALLSAGAREIRRKELRRHEKGGDRPPAFWAVRFVLWSQHLPRGGTTSLCWGCCPAPVPMWPPHEQCSFPYHKETEVITATRVCSPTSHTLQEGPVKQKSGWMVSLTVVSRCRGAVSVSKGSDWLWSLYPHSEPWNDVPFL